MHTKEKIGLELKEKINQNVSFVDISKWALNIYLTDIAANDPDLDATLSTLMMMDQGSEFILSPKELTQIANLLIVGDSPIYTRQQLGKELKEKIQQKVDVAEIGKWAYAMYSEHMLEIDSDFKEFLIDLNAMEDDPQFEFSYEELDKVADKLIAGEKNIDLYNKYNGQPKEQVRQLHIRQNFGKELKERVRAKEHVTIIGSWVRFYYGHMENLGSDFKNLLENLSSMSVGFKNRRSYEELDQIADRLIAGEDVKL